MEGHWAKVPLQALIDRKLLTLDANGNVNPDVVIKRGEVAVILYQSFENHVTVVPNNPGYIDVPETQCYQVIATLTSNGAFSKAEKFNPDAPLTTSSRF